MNARVTRPSDAKPKGEAERSCVVCRDRRSTGALLRLGLDDGRVVLLGRGKRGAYVCAVAACLRRLHARTLSKALRSPVAPVDVVELLADLHALAERRVLEIVGLARRMGALTCGVENVGASARGVALAASDLAERSRRQLGDVVHDFVSSEELGRAAGMVRLGAARIDVDSLAKQAAYWLTLWYESRSEPRYGADHPGSGRRRAKPTDPEVA